VRTLVTQIRRSPFSLLTSRFVFTFGSVFEPEHAPEAENPEV